jgi:hypothetical protein
VACAHEHLGNQSALRSDRGQLLQVCKPSKELTLACVDGLDRSDDASRSAITPRRSGVIVESARSARWVAQVDSYQRSRADGQGQHDPGRDQAALGLVAKEASLAAHRALQIAWLSRAWPCRQP